MNREQLLRYTTAATVLALCLGGVALAQQTKPDQKNPPVAKQQTTATHTGNHQQSEGERIFTQNCARCHTPPDGFSPRISGTIVFHMRVRANLSAHDQQELLRFFNP